MYTGAFTPTYKTAPEGTYRPVFFLSVSEAKVVVVAAGPAKLGTGTLNGGNEIFVRSPAALELIVSFATSTVFAEVIDAAEAAMLRKTNTFEAVVLASLATIDKLSTTAPSLLRQSTSSTHPPPLGVLKSVAVVSAAAPPNVANECSGLSTSSGILLELRGLSTSSGILLELLVAKASPLL
jgi:hypothetical protein